MAFVSVFFRDKGMRNIFMYNTTRWLTVFEENINANKLVTYLHSETTKTFEPSL